MSVSARRNRIARSVLLADIVSIAAASLLAYQFREFLGRATDLDPLRLELLTVLLVVPLWVLILWAVGAYEPHRVTSGLVSVGRFMMGSLGGVGAIAVVSFAGNMQLSRLYVGLLFICAIAFGGLARLVMAWDLRRNHAAGKGLTKVLIVGENEETQAVADAIQSNPWAGYRVTGFLGSSDDAVATPEQVVEAADRFAAGLVVVAPSALESGALRDITISLEGSSIDLAVAPSLFEVVTQRVSVESIGTLPILHVRQVRIEGMRSVAKRLLDFSVAASLSLVLGPIALLAALAVKIDSIGPVFFKQERVGRDGVPFIMWKFRTMVNDAEELLADVVELNEVGHHFFKVREDPRVTRVGRLLRRWSVDEVPQLWNVLRGDMSMAGPRPPLPVEVAEYEDWHHRRLRVRPGITGLWQVSGRSNVAFDEAVRLDIFYIENWSIGFDLRILVRTVGAVLGRLGAY